MQRLWFGFSLWCAACAPTGATQVQGPEGQQRWRLTCQERREQCMRKARTICGDDYVIVDEQGSGSATPRIGTVGPTSTGPSLGAQGNWRGDMLVECGKRQP